jgi:uncharacterized NAD-dependent epimerase/dehydratase family protein
VLLANGLFQTPFAKTSHGLVRGPSRYRIAAVVDANHAGSDAGELLDGRRRDIPIVDSVASALALGPVSTCIVGVATVGGALPEALRADLLSAAEAGLDLVNGLHQPLADDDELAAAVLRNGRTIVDFRRPKRPDELRFWTGDVLALDVPRVAVLGMDCAIGKRTTTSLLQQELCSRGVDTEMIYTGQTGWLQGYPFGFIFDATPNDFVSGELEGALVACARERKPQLMLIEGQSGLRNPAGPCGAEMLLSGAVQGAILQHVPGRRCYEGLAQHDLRIPPVGDEIELIARYGVEVWAVTLNTEGLRDPVATRDQLERELGIPVVLPLTDGLARVVDTLGSKLSLELAQ